MQPRWFESSSRWCLIAASALAAAICLPTETRADVSSGESMAFGISVDLTLIGVPVLTIAPTPVSSGSAPGPYNDADQVLSVSANVPTIASVGTGVLNTAASSDIDGGVGSRFAFGDSLVDDLAITIIPPTFGPSLISLTADTIGSDSMASGDIGSMNTVGNMTLENLAISVSGNALSIAANPDPNTVLIDAAGVRIVLNEQVSSVNPSDASIVTNAIHITLDDIVTGGGLLSGDIIIAHSDASMIGAVPEPATIVGLGGLTLFALLLRRRAR